jgi:putative FmdB family regulatory protein
MPIYEYGCPKCGDFEVRQSMSDPALKRCPTCKSKVQKLISASAFLLKGGGWYSDAYQKKATSTAASTPSPSSTTETSTSSTSTASDSGSSSPAAASTTTPTAGAD